MRCSAIIAAKRAVCGGKRRTNAVENHVNGWIISKLAGWMISDRRPLLTLKYIVPYYDTPRVFCERIRTLNPFLQEGIGSAHSVCLCLWMGALRAPLSTRFHFITAGDTCGV